MRGVGSWGDRKVRRTGGMSSRAWSCVDASSTTGRATATVRVRQDFTQRIAEVQQATSGDGGLSASDLLQIGLITLATREQELYLQRFRDRIVSRKSVQLLIARAGKLTRGRPFVLVKVARPQQDMRFDVPVIGIPTIRAMLDAGATAIHVTADKTLVFDRDELIGLADKKGLSVISG